MLTDELRYKLLKALEKNPNVSQRAIAKELGISLGKVNYCINALLEVGWIKARNFKNSQNKLGYAYLVTPTGIEAKAKVTQRFLQIKIEEYANLEAEIQAMRAELSDFDAEIASSEINYKL
ncbi:MarR family EPS-associated transcriptional regulator [Reinekea sp. G2M2-21]|uniref:MarR family EPS-associated transcriptional regulator n=1 Tax=Reinekea sp. G2M2-21 TaxID=2788942 RepID=UPI0018AB7493|nr:MarR family EPS-associated transcriptional regulator [Reinekea sp. G2M2-21]